MDHSLNQPSERRYTCCVVRLLLRPFLLVVRTLGIIRLRCSCVPLLQLCRGVVHTLRTVAVIDEIIGKPGEKGFERLSRTEIILPLDHCTAGARANISEYARSRGRAPQSRDWGPQGRGAGLTVAGLRFENLLERDAEGMAIRLLPLCERHTLDLIL